MSEQTAGCCCGRVEHEPAAGTGCCSGEAARAAGPKIKTASDRLTKEDERIRRRLRWGIGRNGAAVEPGLYRVNSPDDTSPVLVSANYRMSFDYLRTCMPGKDFWILVLDTKGINVWCAAGKGTFGTEEIVRRIEESGLSGIVSHRKIILPQLGAPGVEPHRIKKETGFSVTYGPVRSEDIAKFIDNGYRADEQMREVRFTLRDRLVLTPVELVQSWKILLAVIPYAVLFHILRNGGVTGSIAWEALLYIGAVVTGAFFTPLLLPVIPGRSLALKGWITGTVFTAVTVFFLTSSPLQIAANFLLLPGISSFISMNFTGSTTYTSLSGVEKEMGIAVPLYIAAAAAATALQILRIFL